MTRRDAVWRGGGAVLSIAACTAAVMLDPSPLIVLLFPLALIGLALTIAGKRAAILLLAERRGHCDTARAIHGERVRRDRSRAGRAQR